METNKRLLIEPFLKKMSLDDNQIELIKNSNYKEHKELFDYVFKLADLFEELDDVQINLDRLEEIKTEEILHQENIMQEILRLKTNKGFD